jgi:hypothetical protein
MERIFVAPAGFYGRQFARSLVTFGKEVRGFLDNNPELIGSEVLGRPVFSPRQAPFLDGSAIYLVGPDQRELQSQLNDLGLAKGIVHLPSKDASKPARQVSEKRNKLISQMVLRMVPLLKDADLKFWAMNSFLLAIKRQKDTALVSDLDIFFPLEDYSRVIDVLTQTGFGIREMGEGENKKFVVRNYPQDPMECEPAVADFKPIVREGTWVISVVEGRKFPARWFDNQILLEFESELIPCPSATEYILETLYGGNWLVDSPTWNSKHTIEKDRAAGLFSQIDLTS